MVEPTPIAPALTESRAEADLPHDFQGLLSICTRCGVYEEGLLKSEENCPVPHEVPKSRLQLVVQLLNGTTRYFPLTRGKGGWKIDPTYRTLVIGKGLGRIILPLDNIEHFSPQDY